MTIEKGDNVKKLNATMIDEQLDAKNFKQYYRDQTYPSIMCVKLELELAVQNSKIHTDFLLVLLDKIKEIVRDRGYVTTGLFEQKRRSLFYQLKLDPCEVSEMTSLFAQIKQVTSFSQGMITIHKINLSFAKNKALDYEKTHKRLLAFLLEQQAYFLHDIKSMDFVWQYRDYLNQQLNVQIETPLNYLKRTEIEICHIIVDLTPAELEHLALGLLYELYYPTLSWSEKRRFRSLGHTKKSYRLLEQLDQLKESEQTKVLVYSFQRRSPVLLNLTEELKEQLQQELSKNLK